jgi:hypothetical protein
LAFTNFKAAAKNRVNLNRDSNLEWLTDSVKHHDPDHSTKRMNPFITASLPHHKFPRNLMPQRSPCQLLQPSSAAMGPRKGEKMPLFIGLVFKYISRLQIHNNCCCIENEH